MADIGIVRFTAPFLTLQTSTSDCEVRDMPDMESRSKTPRAPAEVSGSPAWARRLDTHGRRDNEVEEAQGWDFLWPGVVAAVLSFLFLR